MHVMELSVKTAELVQSRMEMRNVIVSSRFLEITAKNIAAMSIFAATKESVVSMRFFKRPNALASTLLLAITAK